MIRVLLEIPQRFLIWLWCRLARNGQNVATAFVQIWAHKGRSLLTTLGIIIAVTSIISVVSFVEGFGNYVTTMIQGYGTQFIVVHPDIPWGGQRPGERPVTMDIDDIEAVRTECAAVRRLSPLLFQSVTVAYGGETATEIALRGVNEYYQEIRNYYVDAGRFFGPVDVEDGAYVCVLGRTLLKMLECDESIIGDSVCLNDRRFRVIGLLRSKGSMFDEDQDQTVMIPYTTALTIYPENRSTRGTSTRRKGRSSPYCAGGTTWRRASPTTSTWNVRTRWSVSLTACGRSPPASSRGSSASRCWSAASA
jgi:hypothetical protein